MNVKNSYQVFTNKFIYYSLARIAPHLYFKYNTYIKINNI